MTVFSSRSIAPGGSTVGRQEGRASGSPSPAVSSRRCAGAIRFRRGDSRGSVFWFTFAPERPGSTRSRRRLRRSRAACSGSIGARRAGASPRSSSGCGASTCTWSRVQGEALDWLRTRGGVDMIVLDAALGAGASEESVREFRSVAGSDVRFVVVAPLGGGNGRSAGVTTATIERPVRPSRLRSILAAGRVPPVPEDGREPASRPPASWSPRTSR